MSRMEVKSKQIQIFSDIIGLTALLILGNLTGFYTMTYFLAAGAVFFLLPGVFCEISEVLSAQIRSRNQKEQYKNSHVLFGNVLSAQLITGIVTGAVLFFLAPMVDRIFGITNVAFILKILLAAFVFRMVSQVFLGYFRGNGFWIPVLADSILKPVFFGLSAILLAGKLKGYGENVKLLLLREEIPYMYAAAGIAAAAAVTELFLLAAWLLLYFMTKDRFRERDGLKRTEKAGQAVFSFYKKLFGRVLCNLLLTIPFWFGIVLYMKQSTDPAAPEIYGMFSAGFMIIVLIFVRLMCGVLYPYTVRIVRNRQKGEQKETRDLTGTGVHCLFAWMTFPAVFAAVMASQFGMLFLPKVSDQEIAENMFVCGSSLILLLPFCWYLWKLLQISGKNKNVFAGSLLFALAYAAGTAVFSKITAGSISGWIFSLITALVISAVCLAVFVFRIYRCRIDFLYWILIPVMAALCGGVVCFLIRKLLGNSFGNLLTVIVGGIAGAFLSWTVMILLHSFTANELNVIPGKKWIRKLKVIFHR